MKKPKVSAAAVARHAAKLVAGARERTHGSKVKNFDNIAALWSAYLGIRKDPAAPLNAEDVGHLLGLLKIARTQHGGFNPDDYTDAVGYAACTAEVAHALRSG